MTSNQKHKLEKFFANDGPLSTVISEYSKRDIQVQLALAVEKAIHSHEILIAEAGTGTGKTFAYLVPAMLSGKKIIISTGTKNLQEQLFQRDIPLLNRLIKQDVKVELLKGRSNYVCLHRFQQYSEQLPVSHVDSAFLKLRNWVKETGDGDLDKSGLNEIFGTSHAITSTAENCLSQECAFYEKCFVLKARKQAQNADILIINHHLFFADATLREIGFGELLPLAEAIIFDEAHQLTEVASQFLGQSLSSRQFYYLARDIQIEQKQNAVEMPDIHFYAEELIRHLKLMLKAIGEGKKGVWENIVNKPSLKESVQDLIQCLMYLLRLCEAVRDRSKGFENCGRRIGELLQKLQFFCVQSDPNIICWFETNEDSFAIHSTPLSVAEEFKKWLYEDGKKSWIFTSATISINGNISHFMQELGIEECSSIVLPSPFDYQKQALLYLPQHLCDPRSENYNLDFIETIVPILNLTKGRAFVLFTSHKALKIAAEILPSRITFPVLTQGSLSKSKLLSQFIHSPNSILLGTNSFWEGVDVRGDALSCVIIDKIPFTSPEDPVLKSRITSLKQQGLDPFMQFQLPEAVISLRQGVGRLIRDTNDRGLLVLCDPRLTSKAYGQIFLDSLPPMPLTHDLNDVRNFFDI